jgi:hypothetical protein
VGSLDGVSVGSQRMLNGAFHETLHALDDDTRYLRYSIDDGPGAVAEGAVEGYFGEVRVYPVTVSDAADQCVVVWTSSWTAEQGGVFDLCNPVYLALLTDMKAHFG